MFKMLPANLISFFRQISRNKVFTTLNLPGLSSYTTLQRTKEIGICKVNGASPVRIV